MRIAFVHRTVVDYTAETPYERGIGGTESALAYLAAELARLGHSVQMLTNVSAPGRYRGVECLNYKTALTPALLNAADIVVVSNESCGRALREKYGAKKPLVLWCQHADDQPAIESLEYTRERRAWNRFAFVSAWQAEQFGKAFWLSPSQCRVMRNAASPAIAERPPAPAWFSSGAPPTLVYTSAAYRGLDVPLDSFPMMRDAIPDLRLRVFSSLSITRGGAEDNAYADLHRKCLATDGVEYVGPVGQAALAEELRGAAALAYPSTFAETSCVAAIEAMAAGALVVATNLGALPETLAGFGYLVEFQPDPERLAQAFAQGAIQALTTMKRNPAEAARWREKEIQFVRDNYTWAKRALEWQVWLAEIVQQNG
jgi:glycosyltransferase involved in cell wall biosynthesis